MSGESLRALNRLNGIVAGHWESQVLVTACRLRLFDALGDGAATVKELARGTGLQAGALGRVLAALAEMGLVERRGGGYANTDAGRCLAAGAETPMAAMAMWAEVAFGAPGVLDEALRTGGPVWKHGFAEDDPASVRRFCALMDAYGRPVGQLIAEAFDFGACECVLDVGGGSGGVSIEIGKRHGHLRGIVMDRACVSEVADEAIQEAGLMGRFRTEISDLFAGPYPVGADVAVLSWVLHDWNDEHCREILRRCHEALPEGGALLISETLSDGDGPGRRFAALLSLQMLMVCEAGARERTEGEYRALLEETGFVVERVVRMDAPRDLIVARRLA